MPLDAAAFEEISWGGALDETVEALLKAEQQHRSEAVWHYLHAGK